MDFAVDHDLDPASTHRAIHRHAQLTALERVNLHDRLFNCDRVRTAETSVLVGIIRLRIVILAEGEAIFVDSCAPSARRAQISILRFPFCWRVFRTYYSCGPTLYMPSKQRERWRIAHAQGLHWISGRGLRTGQTGRVAFGSDLYKAFAP
jgi:hypothetical protein